MPSESSIKVYNSALSSLSRDLGYEAQLLFPDGYNWLKDHQKIYNVIKLSTSPNTQNTKLFAIKYALDLTDAPPSVIEPYNKYINEVKVKIEEIYKDNKKSQKEEANWLTVEELENILDELHKKLPKSINTMTDYKNVMKYLVLKIHLNSPLRNDLADAKIYLDPTKAQLSEIDKDKQYNYIIVDSGNTTTYFINNEYKTKDIYGQNIINWDLEISKDLIHYANEIISYTDNHVFLVNNDGEKITRNNYTKFIKSIFSPYGKDISTTMIRHIVVSELHNLDSDREKKKKDLAKKMGHSLQTATTIYAKV